jgi:hypothetical protein
MVIIIGISTINIIIKDIIENFLEYLDRIFIQKTINRLS